MGQSLCCLLALRIAHRMWKPWHSNLSEGLENHEWMNIMLSRMLCHHWKITFYAYLLDFIILPHICTLKFFTVLLGTKEKQGMEQATLQINENNLCGIIQPSTLAWNCHCTAAKPVCRVQRRRKNNRACINTNAEVFTTALVRGRYLGLYTVKANREAIRSVHRELLSVRLWNGVAEMSKVSPLCESYSLVWSQLASKAALNR